MKILVVMLVAGGIVLTVSTTSAQENLLGAGPYLAKSHQEFQSTNRYKKPPCYYWKYDIHGYKCTKVPFFWG